jgi:hypothetical protein
VRSSGRAAIFALFNSSTLLHASWLCSLVAGLWLVLLPHCHYTTLGVGSEIDLKQVERHRLGRGTEEAPRT